MNGIVVVCMLKFSLTCIFLWENLDILAASFNCKIDLWIRYPGVQ
jgi:hypothetical protein